MRGFQADSEPLRSKYPEAFGDGEQDRSSSDPNCIRLTITAVFADGTSRVVDFREPSKIASKMEPEPTQDMPFDPSIPRCFSLKVWPAEKQDSVIEITSQIPVND